MSLLLPSCHHQYGKILGQWYFSQCNNSDISWVQLLAPSFPIHNTPNPICDVATVCHQVCCGGLLSLFHKGMSLLNWYKMVCMGGLSYAFIQTKPKNIFFMYLQSWMPWHLHCKFILLLTKKPIYVCVYQKYSWTIAEICNNMGTYDDVFKAVATRENISEFHLL